MIRTSFIALCTLLAAPASTLAQTAPETENLESACVDRGGDATECACVAAQAANRFTPVEQDFIAIAMRPEDGDGDARRAQLIASGMTSQDISSLTQRMMQAEPEIMQACGRGLMRRGRR